MVPLPRLPLISDYITLSELTGDLLVQNKVETRRVIASGLSLLARGWADYLSRRELRNEEIIVSHLIRDRMFLD